MKRNRPLPLKECYRILQLKKGASLDEVKRAYRQRAFALHPDLNPHTEDASLRFQQLNEAYVALSQILQAQEDAIREEEAARDAAARAAQAAQAAKAKAEEPSREARQSAHEAYEQEKARAAAAKAAAKAADEARTKEQKAEKARQEAQAKEQRAASDAQNENRKEDVLRDLLNDPFARRVFEDIYSEIHKQERDARAEALQHETSSPPTKTDNPPSPPKPRKIHMEWGNSKVNLDFTHGVAGAVKGWLRSQIDEEQSFKFPLSSLTPGARLRLQIRRGLSGELTTVEITLPPDFVIGKPVRLKGLGKRVGPWQGDLYLTFEPKNL